MIKKKDPRTGKKIEKNKEVDVPKGTYKAGLEKDLILPSQENQKSELRIALDKKGAHAKKLAKKLSESLDATLPPTYSRDGHPLRLESPDHATILKTVDIILKVRGDFAPDKLQIETKTIILNLTPVMIKGLKDAKAISAVEAKNLKELKHIPIR